jgi:CHAT domain-containing protein/tetratricopeptide (TPR) repeat protein
VNPRENTSTGARGRGRPVAQALVVLLLAAWGSDSLGPTAGPPDELVRAFDGLRVVRPRISGGFDHAPWMHGDRLAAPGGVRLPAEARLALARAERHASPGPEGRPRVVRAQVLSGGAGRAFDAVEPFEALASGAYISDLSAAALVSSEVDYLPHRIVEACDLALRAIEQTPDLPEAHFNAALAFEHLGLVARAADAWRRAADLEARAGWRDEAVDSERRLRAAPDRQQEMARLRAAGPASLGGLIDAPSDADLARELIERELLPGWDTLRAAPAGFAGVRAAAEVVMRMTGDRQPLDAIDYVGRECDAGAARCRDATASFAALAAGMNAWDEERTLEAYDAFEWAHATARPDSPIRAAIELQFARREYYAGQFDTALEEASRVARESAQKGYLRLHGRALWLAGLLAHEKGLFQQAIASYRDARAALLATADLESAGAVDHLLAHYFGLLEDRTRAWEHLVPALRSLPMSRPYRREPVLSTAANLASASGWHRAALAFLEEARVEMQRIQAGASEALVLAGQARELVALGRPLEAGRRLDDAEVLVARVVDPDVRAIVRVAVTAARVELLADDDAAGAIAALTPVIDFHAARGSEFDLARLLLLRGRLLAAAGQRDQAEADWRRGLDLATTQYLRLEPFRERAMLRAARWELYTALADSYAVGRHDPGRAMDVLEAARAAIDAPGVPPVFAEALAAAPDGTLFVTYAVLADRTLAWAAGAGGLTSFVVPHGGHAVREKVERFRRTVQRRGDDAEAVREATALFDLLLGPARARVSRADRLVIVPDGPLSLLPFAALRDGETFLVQRSAIVVAPSFTFALSPPSLGRATSASVLVVGNPAPGDDAVGLPPLPGAGREAREIANLHPDARLLHGQDARRGVFLEALPASDILHFAGHARPNAERPELSQLFLAPDDRGSGAVFLHEIERMPLASTRLVVLAACQSAESAPLSGEGIVGFARAFLAAGVPTVVATLWPIDDDRSGPLFVAFHRELRAGADAPQALRAAQLAVLASDPTADWAAAVVVGRAGR